MKFMATATIGTVFDDVELTETLLAAHCGGTPPANSIFLVDEPELGRGRVTDWRSGQFSTYDIAGMIPRLSDQGIRQIELAK